MRFGNHDSRPSGPRRQGGFRPLAERLEARQLLAIDLANIAGSTTPNSAGPFGVLETGLNNNGGVGFSVAEVGDTNGDGFDDFVVGAPSVVRNTQAPTIGNGGGSRAFLVFGSTQVNLQTIDFATLTPNQRVGDLSALGQSLQTNPTNGTPGFQYDGLTFLTSQNPNAGLGASVAAVGDVNGDGFADFMMGAPGANDFNNATNASGRAYLVYGGRNLNRTPNLGKQVDLDNPTANTDLNILTFVNNAPNASTGRAVGSAGDIFTDGLPDIAIGAPTAAISGLPNSGAVYAISGVTLRPARTQTISLQNVGQGGTANVAGVVFAGANAGDNAGFSLSSAGNFAGAVVSGQNQSDLLIGSPQFNVGPGQVSLIYGSAALLGAGIPVNNFNFISLNRLGTGTTVPIGATFTGAAVGDQTGFSVATAGDFNNDGVADIMIGSPGFNNATGRVNVIFGRSASGSSLGAITGSVPLSAIPSGIQSVEFVGSAPGSLAGFSTSGVLDINGDKINEIVIGAPGFGGSVGLVYLIAGNSNLQGTVGLGTIEAAPAIGVIIGQSVTTPGSLNYFGSSVSGRLVLNSQGRTLDGDNLGDFIIGSAGFSLNASRVSAGGVYAVEGRFVPLPVPPQAITSNIAVGTVTAPFVVDPAATSLTIFILSSGSNVPGFDPFADIDPATLTVNGVAVPPPVTLTQEADLDNDGIPDASFVFTPLTSLGLVDGSTTTFTVRARTDAAGAVPNRNFVGTAQVTVTGTPLPPSGGGGGARPAATGTSNTVALPFGERLVPANPLFNRLRYKPLPLKFVQRQFLPTNGFAFRNHEFFHPSDSPLDGQGDGAHHNNSRSGTDTLPSRVFTRGRFPKGTFRGRIRHQGPTAPNNP